LGLQKIEQSGFKLILTARASISNWLRIPKYWPDRYGTKTLISGKSEDARLLLEFAVFEKSEILTQIISSQ